MPQMEQVEDAVGIDSHRSVDWGKIGVIAHRILQVSDRRRRHSLAFSLFGRSTLCPSSRACWKSSCRVVGVLNGDIRLARATCGNLCCRVGLGSRTLVWRNGRVGWGSGLLVLVV